MPRKVAFSGKKKKNQILEKRLKNSQKFLISSNVSQGENGEAIQDTELKDKKLMEQPQAATSRNSRNKNVNRYNLQFYQESKREVDMMRSEAFEILKPVEAKEREITSQYFEKYDFPLRPEWNYNMAKTILDQNENRYFREYVDKLKAIHHTKGQDLSLFELNLETWRQLWRVLEISDILLVIVDVRYASLMFPPSLHEYIVNTLKKHVIVVLNKVDLVTPEAVVAWQEYFAEKYPGLPLVLFATLHTKQRKGYTKGARAYQRSMEGVQNIYKACKKLVKDEVNLSSWQEKILEDMNSTHISTEEIEHNSPTLESCETHCQPSKMYNNGILTLGCIGFPNVGKSTLINALKGRKVVSVSRTPGHTKHFQTIFLTPHVRLCDCPGLVFPSSTPKHLQVLLGSYPISQLQVPFRSLKLLAEHLDLPQILKLKLPEDYEHWSSAAVSDAWAIKRGFMTAKAARPDRYRAANHLLRMCLAGQQQLILQFYPPGYEEQKEKWQQHSQIAEVKKYQNIEVESHDSSSDSDCVDEEQSSSNDENIETDDTDEEIEEISASKTHNAFALLGDD